MVVGTEHYRKANTPLHRKCFAGIRSLRLRALCNSGKLTTQRMVPVLGLSRMAAATASQATSRPALQVATPCMYLMHIIERGAQRPRSSSLLTCWFPPMVCHIAWVLWPPPHYFPAVHWILRLLGVACRSRCAAYKACWLLHCRGSCRLSH